MNTETQSLPLHEQLFLLALDDEDGSVVFSASTALPYALAGALVLDMLDRGLLSHIEGALVVTGGSTGDTLMDEVTGLLHASRKARSIDYWVLRLPGKIRHFKRRIAESLVTKGVLRAEKHHFLWVFEYDRYPELDARPEQAVLKKVRGVVLRDEPADEEAITLLSLIRAAELIGEVFGKGERREARRRIKELTRGEVVGKAVSSAVASVNAAVMIAITTSAAAAASSS